MWLHIFATLCKFFCKEIGNCKLIVLLLPLRFLDFILPSRNFFYRKRRTFGRVSDILFEINCVNIWSGYTSDGNVIRGGKLERGERRIELVMSFVHYIPQVCYQRIRWWKVKLTFKKREIKRKRLIANKQIDCEKFKFLYFSIFFFFLSSIFNLIRGATNLDILISFRGRNVFFFPLIFQKIIILLSRLNSSLKLLKLSSGSTFGLSFV